MSNPYIRTIVSVVESGTMSEFKWDVTICTCGSLHYKPNIGFIEIRFATFECVLNL